VRDAAAVDGQQNKKAQGLSPPTTPAPPVALAHLANVPAPARRLGQVYPPGAMPSARNRLSL
jgi:hypothetical protein